MKHTGRNLILAALLSLGANFVFAADMPLPPEIEKFCKDNAAQCTAVKERAKKACDADPKKCEEVKAKIGEEIKKCQADPKACQEKIEKVKGKIAERQAEKAAK